MNPSDTSIYTLSILDRFQNRPDDVYDFCLADFA